MAIEAVLAAAAGGAVSAPSAAPAAADVMARALALSGASPSPPAWTRFLSRALLLIGAGFLLAGITCFFAFNWQSLGKFAKFGLLEGAIVACAIVGWWRPHQLVGRVALAGAAVLVGPLLAVFGQTYQTGADPWGLFAAWVVLIAPWVIAAQFTPLWLIAIALCDLALTLFWVQVPDITIENWMLLFPLLAAIHAIAVVAWEWQRRRPTPWLTDAWAPRLLVTAAFALLLVPALVLVLGLFFEGTDRLIGFAVFWIAVGAVFAWYLRGRPDLFMLTAAAGSVLTVITFALYRLLLDEWKLGELGRLMMAAFVIVEVTLVVAWLRWMARSEARA